MFEVCCVLGFVLVLLLGWHLAISVEAKRAETAGVSLRARLGQSERLLAEYRKVEATMGRRGPFGG